MGGIVAQNFEPFRRLASDDRNGRVVVDNGREIAHPAVDPDRDRRLARPGPIAAAISAPVTGPANSRLFAVGQCHDDRRLIPVYRLMKDFVFTHR